MKKVITTMTIEQNKFLEDLLWCPSQIYYYFISSGRKFCIYLRWRYKNPWTAELIECDDDWEFSKNWREDWHKLTLSKEYKDEEYKDLEKEVLDKIAAMFPNLEFPNNSEDKTMQFVEDESTQNP